MTSDSGWPGDQLAKHLTHENLSILSTATSKPKLSPLPPSGAGWKRASPNEETLIPPSLLFQAVLSQDFSFAFFSNYT